MTADWCAPTDVFASLLAHQSPRIPLTVDWCAPTDVFVSFLAHQSTGRRA